MGKKIVEILLVALVFLLGWYVGKRMEHTKFPDIKERTDTLFFWDTVVVDKPFPVEVIKWKTVPEYLAVHDTTFLHDSVLVDVPIERRIYQEDSTFYAVVSGFKPSLDTLKVFNKTTYIEKTRNIAVYKPYKWSVGPFVSQEVGLSHYAAKVGIAGDFGFRNDRFRFQPEVGHYWMPEGKHDWYAGGRIQYNLFRKK